MTSMIEQAITDVIQSLHDAGFVGDGQSIAGRQRYAKVGTNIKATVGQRTTAIYRIEGPGLEGVKSIASFRTKDVGDIRAILGSL